MQARITRFKMRPEAAAEAEALMHRLKPEIVGQPGVRHCMIVMNPDGRGHVIAMIDEDGGSPEAVDRLRALWHRFADHLESIPDPEIFEVVADWSPDAAR
jgi:hypothetical protein